MRAIKRLLWAVVIVLAVGWGYNNRATYLPQVETAVGYYGTKLATALSGHLSSQLVKNAADNTEAASSSSNSSKTKTSTTTTSSTGTSSSTSNVVVTPTESIVQGVTLSKTYYYQFDSDLSAAGRRVFKDAIAEYNATGLVHLVEGTAPKRANSITFSVYYKKMAADSSTVELGHGGPKIVKRVSWKGTTTWNEATASLNGDYSAAFSDSVAVHELGHALGLDHSTSTDSVMYPVSQGKYKLSTGDIDGLKKIYNKSK
ncbi:matrixin family metalloprotease [Lactiplantibacillus fabifermentans]|uniref:Peptidase M10 n=1 Tax=Lactiplantibacillus fabifermentans T30PCM01 TaxID=1400520 RepID=W6T5M2_9LACO|nr:matrixin family metalloprotease [Lactiplantibacillus fabifermentans]ETY73274.1 peptidase M10 [Lactiplantibacillus fabifermentans T30PCM01]